MGSFVNESPSRVTKRCLHCGRFFQTDTAWKYLCMDCFKASKKKEIAQLKKDVEYWKQEAAYWKGECRRAEDRQEPRHNGEHHNGELHDMVPLMIRLCHPDKHGNSELSNKVTQWLLSLREKVRQ